MSELRRRTFLTASLSAGRGGSTPACAAAPHPQRRVAHRGRARQSHGTTNQSPRAGTAHYVGHVAIDADGHMTVSLRNILYTKNLEPQRC